MRILLTGSTGVIGRRVVPLLLKAGHQLTAVARSPEKRLALERAGAAAVTVDLFDPLAVRQAVRGHDAVVTLRGPLGPLLDWLARHEIADLHIETIGLAGIYGRYHGADT